MEVNAKLDVGENLTSLLERLAQQIGTTVDKVYPWYVQQAYLEGVTTLVALTFFVVVFLTILVLGLRKADWENGNAGVAASIVGGAGLFFCVLAVPREGIDGARKIMNPNFYAMQMLTADIGRLRGR